MTSALLPITLLGAVLGLDTVSFPQAMLSRPLVAATLGGTLFGSPLSGLLMGAALELIAVETLPFGASRYPEWGSASAVGGALFASHPAHPAGAMTIAMVASLATAWFGGWTMVKLRQRNAVWAQQSRRALDAGARGAVISVQLKGLTGDMVRGSALTAVSWLVFAPLTAQGLERWSVNDRTSSAIVVAVSVSVAAGAAWKLFHASIPARWLFAAGLAAGFSMMVLR